MMGLLVVFPPWIFGVLITLLGRWGERRWMQRQPGPPDSPSKLWPVDWGSVLITNLVFMSLVPISLLSAIRTMIPFTGPRAGLAIGIVAFLFGALPVRLLGASRVGWDQSLWQILCDLVQIGGAMAIVGWLVA